MLFRLFTAAAAVFFCINAAAQVSSPQQACRVALNFSSPQYEIGYGSLMNEKSKRRSAPDAGDNFPVMIKGLRRGWVIHGTPVGYSATYLGVTKQEGAFMNAIIFRVTDTEELKATDRRESSYCRVDIKPSDITMLNKQALPKGEYWIYTVPKKMVNKPDQQYPVVQSYVDLFLTGCLNLEAKYQLKGFAKNCVLTTANWPDGWVNDRIYPRRPFIYQPNAMQIDKLLKMYLPQKFKKIRLE